MLFYVFLHIVILFLRFQIGISFISFVLRLSEYLVSNESSIAISNHFFNKQMVIKLFIYFKEIYIAISKYLERLNSNKLGRYY